MAPVDDLAPEPAGAPSTSISVYYGSQTGTAEEVACDLAREGRKRGISLAAPAPLNELSVEALAQLGIAVFIVATTGQGDPPVNMRWLWEALVVASLPTTLLCNLRYAVFGLGDSHYREFNYAARKLHARLQRLGAKPFYRLGLGDDQHDFGLEQELDPWTEGLWEALSELKAPMLPPDVAAQLAQQRHIPSLEVLELPEAGEKGDDASRSNNDDSDRWQAEVVCNDCLCTPIHTKEEQDVRNVRLQPAGGQAYTAGDVCVVWPETDPSVVQRFIVETLGLTPQKRVQVKASSSTAQAHASSSFPSGAVTLEELFSKYVDISAVPSRHFFAILSQHTDHELHKKKLSEFASRSLEAKDALYEYCKREKRSAAEVMWDFWTARPPLAALLETLPPMRPRRYSIASCPGWHSSRFHVEPKARHFCSYRRWMGTPLQRRLAAHPAVIAACSKAMASGRASGSGRCDLDLCVAVVQFTTKMGRECKGLCSSFLQQRSMGARLMCSFERGSLSLPPPDVPMILVCPGTGLSPCRALVQQRHLNFFSRQGTAGGHLPKRLANGLKDLMFLGFRHKEGDYLYAGEWETFKSWLSVHVAFSRDDPERKVYVQDIIEEHGKEVCALLDAGAQIFVCGRAHPMPAQVFDAFTEVLHIHRGLTMEQAAGKLRELQQRRRYICDTWG